MILLRLVILLAVLVIGGGAAPRRPGRAAVRDRRDRERLRPRARDSASTGLGQIKPGTARDAGCRGSLFDAAANADCSARILVVLLHDAGGDWRRAAAHYNQGRFARGSAGAGYARLVLARARRRAS